MLPDTFDESKYRTVPYEEVMNEYTDEEIVNWLMFIISTQLGVSKDEVRSNFQKYKEYISVNPMKGTT